MLVERRVNLGMVLLILREVRRGSRARRARALHLRGGRDGVGCALEWSPAE
jgi:hypothetical protein